MKNLSASEVILGSVKWSEMFDNENELISLMKEIDIQKYKKDLRKGYYYIEGFQKTDELSKKQITQLKRLAKEVYRYYHNF